MTNETTSFNAFDHKHHLTHYLSNECVQCNVEKYNVGFLLKCQSFRVLVLYCILTNELIDFDYEMTERSVGLN